ncbi:maleylpyruvate isomerase family mycothiol-dependent enzyme [Streptomyces sp. NPDC002143]
MKPETLSRTELLSWLTQGTNLLRIHVPKLTDSKITGPTALEGWTVGHLLAHLARNADALSNLAHWAATGIETPMYPGGADQRLSDIESGAARPPGQLVDDVLDSADRLQHRLDGLTPAAWTAPVRTAQGRTVTAALIPWLRIREVWLHLVDLDVGVTVDDFPDGLVAVLLPDALATLATRLGCPPLVLLPRPRGVALVSDPTAQQVIEVSGRPSDLLSWITGRGYGELLTANCSLPDLPAWL